jgi:glutamate dehydrogenase
MARGALRDDLYAVLESLTRSVLEVSNPRHDAAARLAEWSELNSDALGRARAALGGIERMSHAGIAALSVALRTLRTVTKPASSGQPAPAQVEASRPSADETSPASTNGARKASARKSTAAKKAAAKPASTTTAKSAAKKAASSTKKAAKKPTAAARS